jgi:hypothetical protein
LDTVLSEAFAQEYGDWDFGIGGGAVDFTLRNGPGNQLSIGCAMSSTDNRHIKVITVTMVDRGPPPNSQVNVILDDNQFKLQTDTDGNIKTDSDNFIRFWNYLPRASTMLVQLSDGRASKFPTLGVQTIKESCAQY